MTSPSTKSALPQKEGSGAAEKSLFNVPNTLCAIRFFGSLIMIALTWTDLSQTSFLVLIIFLQTTDWVDGKLAIMLDQRTRFGAKLDSVADATFYASVLLVTWWLKGDVLRAEGPLIVGALLAYAVNMGASFAKFRRFASYHTRAAKTCWLLVSIAIVFIFADWSPWALRIASIGVILANLEETAITFVLKRPHVDVSSLYHALKLSRVLDEATTTESSN